MPELQGQVGELTFTLQITRKDTGKVEEVQLIGKITDAQMKELKDGSHTLDSSTGRSD